MSTKANTETPATPAAENTTTAIEILNDLNAGVFVEQLGRALSNTALGVCSTGKKGEVSVKFSFKQIGESNQVAVSHKLVYVQPTMRGKVSEEYTTDTPLHVGRGGKLTLLPDTQTDMFRRNQGE